MEKIKNINIITNEINYSIILEYYSGFTSHWTLTKRDNFKINRIIDDLQCFLIYYECGNINNVLEKYKLTDYQIKLIKILEQENWEYPIESTSLKITKWKS